LEFTSLKFYDEPCRLGMMIRSRETHIELREVF
jgi:hypothetical protein